MIRTLIFDLGKTLVPFDLERGFKELERYCPRPAEDLRRILLGSDLPVRFERGELTPEEFVREVSALLEMQAGPEAFSDAWNSIFLPEPLIPDLALELLHTRHRMLLLSNTNVLHFEWIAARYPLLRHFDHFVLSYKAGAVKPQRAIYEEALRHAQCAPEECFYADDIPAYVEAAKALGIDGVVFESWELLQGELARRGVEVR